MAWVKISDDAMTYPRLLSVAEHENYYPGAITEVFGFFVSLVTITAGHLTDGVIGFGECRFAAEDAQRAWKLIDLCEFAGLMHLKEGEGRKQWQLLNDGDFVGFKTAEEVMIDRDRKRDTRNPKLTGQVRLRDGDQCRYCGKTVDWTDRKGNRGATYDHRKRGSNVTPADMVVSCRECNSRRGNAPVEVADQQLPLLPAPVTPWYSNETHAWFARNKWAKDNGITLPGQEKDTQAELPIQYPDEQPDRTDTTTKPEGGDVEKQPAPSVIDEAEAAEVEEPSWLHSTPRQAQGADATSRSTPRVDVSRPVTPDSQQEEDPPGEREFVRSTRSRSDLGQEADVPGLSGTGRDGPGRSGKGRHQQQPGLRIEHENALAPPGGRNVDDERPRSGLSPGADVPGLSGTGRDGPGRFANRWRKRAQNLFKAAAGKG